MSYRRFNLVSTKCWKFFLEFRPRSYHSFISIFVTGTNDQRASNGRLQNFDDGSTFNEPTIYNLLKMNYWILEKIHVNAEINEWRIRNSWESFFNQPHQRHYFGLLVPVRPFRGQKGHMIWVIGYDSESMSQRPWDNFWNLFLAIGGISPSRTIDIQSHLKISLAVRGSLVESVVKRLPTCLLTLFSKFAKLEYIHCCLLRIIQA